MPAFPISFEYFFSFPTYESYRFGGPFILVFVYGDQLHISEDQLFYCLQRGLDEEDAVSLIVNGFCKEVMKELPMEFAVEAQKLIGISLEGSVG